MTSGRLGGTDLAVITLIPLAAFELVVGLPVATQALQRVRQAAARVFEVTDAPVPVCDPDSPSGLPDGPYDLQAQSVWAGYPGAASPALRGVDLSLPPGRRVAVIGPSGAGKSTLAAVLLRFLPVESGTVCLNGLSLDRLAGDALRTVVGMVGQNVYLFDDTIAANLRIGHRSATDDQLYQVLERVGLVDWVHTLPRALATDVGRHGGRLSGGQRQRIALARALLADVPVLVLDEPTEHLEPAAVDDLTAQLLDVTEKRSLLLITHRVAGLECVDEILVMDAGRVVERGSHDALLDQGGTYAHLWWEEMFTSRHGVEAANSATPRNSQPTPTAAAPNGGRIDRSARR